MDTEKQRESKIRQWFSMWLRKQDTGIVELFAPDAVYIESWRPEYHGSEKIKLWFDEWNTRGTVERWDIRQYFHKGDQTVVEWAFRCAMADGTVINCADCGVFGAYAEIDHGGVLVRYANLSMLYAIRAGDPVRAGQTIGFIGRTMPEECDLPAHLHLRIVVGNTAVDPEKVLQNGIFPDP